MSDRPVVTRIAPSPTGSMHIGTARTALFNWLYARHTGGKYLIRVEDTDRERSTAANVEVIFEGMKWLGLEADETPLFQAARVDRHRLAVDEMLARGSAYRDYMTPEELEAERTNARAEGRVVRSPWRSSTMMTCSWPPAPCSSTDSRWRATVSDRGCKTIRQTLSLP